jgi:hypothetical protein
MSPRLLIVPIALLMAACASTPQAKFEPAPPPTKAPGAVPIGEFLASVYTYPTGRYDARWWEAARVGDAKLASAVPTGDFSHLKGAKALNPNAFTPMGPQPIQDGADLNTGRINDIVVSPQPLIPGNPDSYRAFAASDGGGVWRSENCCSPATTWEPVTDDPDIESIAIGDLEIDPNNPDVIYAGTGDLRFGSWAFGSAGVLKSVDGGDSWGVIGRDVFVPNYPASLSAFSQYQAVGKVVVDPNNSQKLAVGTKTGLYFSYDAGSSWTGPCLTNPYGPTSNNPHRQDITGLLALNFAGSTTLIAAVGTRGAATPVQPDLDFNGANGIYRASMPAAGCPTGWQLISRPDNGWPANTGAGTAFGPIGRIEIAAAPQNPNILYAKAIDPQSFAIIGLWRSSDAGNSWQPRATPANFSGCEPGTQNWYNAGITVSPTNVDDVVLSAWWLYRSIDGAATFSNLVCATPATATVHIDQHARAFVGGDPNRLLIGNDGGVYYSANATLPTPTFTPLNGTINAVEFYSGDIIANFATANPRVMIGGAQDNGTSALIQFGDEARPDLWLHAFGGDGITTRIEPVFGQRVYMSSQRGNIVVSVNGANAPEFDANGPWGPRESSGDRKSFLMPFDLYKYGDTAVADSGCAGNDGCNHLIAGTYRVWESTNGANAATAAARWTAISPDLSKNNLIVGTDNRSVIQALRFAVSTRRVAMAGTLDGNVWFGFGLGTGAASWVNVTGNNTVLPNRSILGVATDPLTPTIGYAAVAGFGANTPSTPGHVYQVRCNADCSSFSWRDVSGNLPDIPANTVMVNPWIPRQVFVGTDWGLYYTNDVEAAQPVWRRFATLPRAMVWDLAIDRGFSTLAVFTRSRGAWVWPLPREIVDPGGPLDEPSVVGFPLPAPNPANASCPAGFFIAAVDDGPGAGLTPGAFGMEVLLDDPGTRVLAGGLNFGGLIDGSQVGFAGFNFANAANENQRLNLRVTGSKSDNLTRSLPVRIRIARRPDANTSITVFETTTALQMETAYVDQVDLPPGFYEATVAAVNGDPGGAADGQFFFELTTSFLDRPGGGFQGGAVVGGYHAAHPFGGVSGFAAFCLATPHSTSIRVLSRPTYGPSGAQDLRLRIQDAQQRDLLVVPAG